MGNPKNDSGEKNNSSNSSSSSNSGANSSSAQSKENLAKLPPAGFIYSDDENLMDELSMGWGLTANDEQDELDAIINKTVDMSKVSNTKLKALSEPPKSGVERIERVRAERASREIDKPDTKAEEEKSEREAALRRAKQAAAEKEEAQRAAAQREKAERQLAERQEAERKAALEERAREEAEAKELAERAAREREEQEEAERARIELEQRELAEKREAEKQEREKAARDAAEREEAEREIAERERLQKEAAAKLRAKQEEAKREAAEAAEQERLEQERLEQERFEQERLDQERIEREKEQQKEKKAAESSPSEKEPAAKSAAAKAGSLFGNVLQKNQIKVQKIGPKADDSKIATEPAAKETPEPPEKKEPESSTPKPSKPSEDQTTTTKTAKLSRTPEEELAALLAEDEEEPKAAEEPPKPAKKLPDSAEAKVSRSGLTALEPTDDTPLTGVLKAIKPDAAKSADKGSKAAIDDKDKAKANDADSSKTDATTAGDIASQAKEEIESPETPETPQAPEAPETSESPETPETPEAPQAPEALKDDEPPKGEKGKDDKLDGVDKFYKPERVKLSDFVRRSKTDPESKPASKFTAPAEKSAESAAVQRTSDAESANLPSDNLPAPLVAQTDLSTDAATQTKNDIRESVKAESPEKKAAIIAALKKLEDQVDESNLDSLSTAGLKDVLSKLPDMDAASPAADGKAEEGRKRPQSPAMARLAAKEEPSPDRDLAREKLKVMQKMGHTLPAVKSYLPHKRILLIMAAVTILGALAAVALVRWETIAAREALKKKDYTGALNSLGIVLTLYPFSAEAHQLKGSALYLSGNLKDAYTEYDTALSLSPGMKDALARRAAVSYQLGNYSQSVEDYEKLLQQESGEFHSFDRLLSLANAYLGVGDVQKANDMYNRCLAKKPNHAPAIAGKIAVSIEKKLYERAALEATKALASNPTSDELLVLRARAYTGLLDFPPAEKDLAAALKKNPKSATAYAAKANMKLAQKKEAEAYASFDKAIKLNPKDATFILDRAAAYIKNGKFDLAAKDIQKAKSVMGTQQTARLYVLNSQIQIANKQAQKALEDLKTAQAKFPKNPDIILAQADALAAVGKLSDGIMACEKAMEMDKNDVDAILKHGLLSLRFGNKMRAVEDFAEVIRLDPRNVSAYKTRGMLYFQQEKYASAQEDLNKVLALDPSQTDAQATLTKAKSLFAKLTRVSTQVYQREGPSDAYLASLATKDFGTLLNDGFNAYKKGDVMTAVPTLEQAVKVNPRDARARRYLAYAYKSADQLGEAASQFDALYPLGALSPQDTLIYIEMLSGSGQSEKAAKVLEEAIAKTPGNQALYLQLANSQANAGEIPKAVQTCNKGIAINPRSAIAQELISLRNNLLNGGSPNKEKAPTEQPGA
jgi:tetratricopeptide (TPR) repeat protein